MAVSVDRHFPSAPQCSIAACSSVCVMAADPKWAGLWPVSILHNCEGRQNSCKLALTGGCYLTCLKKSSLGNKGWTNEVSGN